MIGASLYIIVCSVRNRIRQRLRRLREPRYLIGAVVGVAYLYFSFFARFRMSGVTQRRRAGRTARPLAVLSALRNGAPGAIGIALLALTALGWLLPFDSGLLDFSQAEIQFLFPAPVSRRELLVHRLLRSQLGLLFGSVITGLVAPSISGFARLRISLATWLLLSTGKVYFTGISLARARLGSRDARILRVAWLPLIILGAAIAVVGVAIVNAFNGAPLDSLQDVLIRVGTVTTTGLSSIVLWPFIALARPLFAPWPGPYLTALGWASVVLLATVLWVLQSDAAFEDAAAIIAQRKAQEPKKALVQYHVRSSALPLATQGRPEIAFAWKAATQTMRIFGKTNLMRLAAIVFALTMTAASMGRGGGLATLVGSFALATCIFAVTLAPQALRVDMRDDLQHLEMLKTWPIRAATVVRGELLWPGVLLTALAWAALAITELLTAGTVLGRVSLSWRLSAGAAFAMLAPALVFAQLTIHNAAALIFPAWVPQGNQRPRGLDALGQRLIMMFGTWLALIVSAIPGAILGGIVGFVLWRLLGPAAVVPAAVVCAAVMAIEILLATEMLGPAYERLDVTAVERAE